AHVLAGQAGATQVGAGAAAFRGDAAAVDHQVAVVGQRCTVGEQQCERKEQVQVLHGRFPWEQERENRGAWPRSVDQRCAVLSQLGSLNTQKEPPWATGLVRSAMSPPHSGTAPP